MVDTVFRIPCAILKSTQSENPFMVGYNRDPESNIRRAQTSHMRHLVAAYWRTAVSDYRDAGMPFGETVLSMLIWYEYGQKTTTN